jgi:aldehyde:ferredoxin oxidoreductase
MTLNGYGGSILRIDLSKNEIRVEPTGEAFARDYLGGRGFVAKILYDEVPAKAHGLDPENRLVIAPGPFSGLFLPGSGKVHIGCKSPATGGYGDSNMGGHFAPEIRYAGYDAIVITGAAAEPSFLHIDDDRVEIRSAKRYWGRGAIETETMLKEDLGDDFQIATIGKAGENKVNFACISHDFGRQSGRTGVGAVMGSKNLKAIAIRGTRSIPLARPQDALAKGKEMYETCFAKPGFKEWTPYGTAGVTDWVNEIGAFPTRNFRSGWFESYQSINGKVLKDTILVTDKGCFGCPTPCGKYSRALHAGNEVHVEGPEYETIALIGGNCALKDIHDVAYANYVCDDLGLDTISGGNVAAFAIECFERGILTEQQVGRRLAFGDLDSVIYLFEKIAGREGIGELLSLGVKAASQRLGQGSEKFAIHVKGLEWSGYEARWAPAMMLSYITADIGAHHNRSWAITYDVAVGREKLEGKAQRVVDLQHIRPLFDVLGICRLQWVEIGFELEHYAGIFPLVTGVEYSWADLLKISEKIWNLTRSFNIKHIPGFGRAWDYPPARFMEEPIPDGPSKGRFIDRKSIDALLDDYYRIRGWTNDGKPAPEKLRELGLSFVLKDLEKAGT